MKRISVCAIFGRILTIFVAFVSFVSSVAWQLIFSHLRLNEWTDPSAGPYFCRIIEYSEWAIGLVLCVLLEPQCVSGAQNSLACVHCTVDICLHVMLPNGILIVDLQGSRKREPFLFNIQWTMSVHWILKGVSGEDIGEDGDPKPILHSEWKCQGQRLQLLRNHQ